MYKLTIHHKPIAKGRSRSTSNGHHYTPPKTRDFEELIKNTFIEQNFGCTPLQGALRMEITFYFKRPKNKKHEYHHTCRPDLTNLAKSIEDGLNGLAYFDDSQIAVLIMSKKYDTEDCIYVEIANLGKIFLK